MTAVSTSPWHLRSPPPRREPDGGKDSTEEGFLLYAPRQKVDLAVIWALGASSYQRARNLYGAGTVTVVDLP